MIPVRVFGFRLAPSTFQAPSPAKPRVRRLLVAIGKHYTDPQLHELLYSIVCTPYSDLAEPVA